MKKYPLFLSLLLGSAIMFTLHFTSCKGRENCNLTQVKIGEIKDGVPVLTYPNIPKLKRAMQLAFLPTMRIDTIFLYNNKDSAGKEVVILAVAGQETDSIHTTVNFTTRQINGISLISKPVGDEPKPDPLWCSNKGCGNYCIMYSNKCFCGSTSPNDLDPHSLCDQFAISAPGGTPRPVDILDLIVPYLAMQ